MSIWMIFTPRSATSTSHDAYVGGSQSLRYAKTLIVKVCIPSSHPYLALVLISTAQCITGLRSKRLSANPGAITATLATGIMIMRIRNRHRHDAGTCRLSPQNSDGQKGSNQIWVDNLKNTSRRSRGAIGRYLAALGAPLAGARRPRRPWTALEHLNL